MICLTAARDKSRGEDMRSFLRIWFIANASSRIRVFAPTRRSLPRYSVQRDRIGGLCQGKEQLRTIPNGAGSMPLRCLQILGRHSLPVIPAMACAEELDERLRWHKLRSKLLPLSARTLY